jgi:uncharacterized protein
MKNTPITICGVEIQPGEKLTLAMPNPEIYSCAPLHIPMHIIHGKKAGPRILICATLYGDEVNGIAIVDRLLNLSILKNLAGTLLCIPVMNVYGLINHSRYLPDGKDLAKSFPGSNGGSFAARLAHLFSSQILDHMTHCVNIRSGSQHIFKLPQIYFHPEDPEAKSLATSFDTPIIHPCHEKTGFFYSDLKQPKIPTLIFEGGEANRSDEYTIKLGLRGIVKMLRQLQMIRIKNRMQGRKPSPLIAENTFWIRASSSGLFHFIKKVGKQIQKGEKLASITDPFGSTKHFDIIAPKTGIITAINTHPHVYEGQGIIEMAELKTLSHASIEIPPIKPDIVDY